MVINREQPNAHKYKIHDCTGQVIPYVTFFDTDTCEIEMAIFLRNERVSDNQGEYKIVTNTDDLVDNVKEHPCLLMQPATNSDGETSVGCTFVRFKLPGAYATYDGRKIENSVAAH